LFTTIFPNGEIRGFLTPASQPVPEPTSLAPRHRRPRPFSKETTAAAAESDRRVVVIARGLDVRGPDVLAEPKIANGALVRVLADWCSPFAGYFLYYPSRRQQPAALSALIDTLRL
jgi:DNA-binding transcriptional LysR family regulator